MNEECPRCREYVAKGGFFCGACGRRLRNAEGDVLPTESDPFFGEYAPMPEKQQFGLIELILLAVCFVVMAIAVFEAITLAVHIPEISLFLSDKYLYFFLLTPFPQTVFFLHGFALQAYLVLMTVIIIACVTIAIRKLADGIRAPGGKIEPGGAENTAAFWICIFLCAGLVINFIVTLITTAAGSEIGVPDFGGKIEQMFLMADAAFWEEIVTRMLFIGVPMALISLVVTRKKESFKCLFGGFGMSMTAVALIIISGVIFGLAHYPGWENQLWKVISTGVMGIFLGYLFVRFGLYAAILLHFITNFLSSFNWMGAEWLLIILTLLLLAMGFVALAYILKRLSSSGRAIKSLPSFKNGFIKTNDRI